MVEVPLFVQNRLRSTPFSEKVAEYKPVYTIYNRMMLPSSYGSLEENAHHLKTAVQVWDVSAQRQVEIIGTDAHKLVTMLTPRDLTKAEAGRCYYAPITNREGGIINDPVAVCLDENRFWLSLADSDLLLWVNGLATGLNLNVQIFEPDVSPLAIQGPRAEDVVARLFGEEIRAVKPFRFMRCAFHDRPQVVARSGWSKQGGFEIYLDDFSLGNALWDAVMEAGKDFDIRPGCPNLIERIESGLLSFGNDMYPEDTPLECGLDKFCSISEDGHDFIGKPALLRQQSEGFTKALRGVHIAGKPLAPLAHPWHCWLDDKPIGEVRSAVWSPDLSSNIGNAMLNAPAFTLGTSLRVATPEGDRQAEVCTLPFV